MIPIVVIQGPTAVGKSKLAMQLAAALETEIISADSRQIYKFLDIGTAKPSVNEQKKIRHHLIDIIEPNENYSAGDFVQQASVLIKKIHATDKTPIICGGTMFYIKSLQEGIFKAPQIPDYIRQILKDEAAENGSEVLYKELISVDPASAKRTDPNDLNRIIRALEIYRYTSRTITEFWQENPAENNDFIFFNIILLEDRKILYKRIENRIDKMLERGLIEEFQYLVEKGYNEHSPGLNTVGYKELFAWQKNEMDFSECIRKIKQHTRNYAKRQLTWYRKAVFDLTLQASDITFYPILKEIRLFLDSHRGES